MNNIWFTSDLHLGHFNIIKYCNRPFYSIEEMNEKIVSNWNSVVKNNDTIYCLGDVAFGNQEKYLSQLQGNIILIKGNHDKKLDLKYFSSVYDYFELTINDKIICNVALSYACLE